jgi:hypothetical protein
MNTADETKMLTISKVEVSALCERISEIIERTANKGFGAVRIFINETDSRVETIRKVNSQEIAVIIDWLTNLKYQVVYDTDELKITWIKFAKPEGE